MVKKISAILLALILCLSMMAVHASAAVELGDADLAFALEWDKEYYSAGDTAKLSVYIDVADDYSLYTGSFIIGLNSAQISQDDNAIDDVRASATTDETFRSYFKGADTQLTWLATTVASKVTAANTADEQALYDHYLKYTGSKDTAGGTHENTATNKAGFNGSDFDPSVPVMTISFVVAADVADGTVLNAAITSGSLTCSPVQTTWKYYKSPTTATTTANIAATSIDVTQATAIATVGTEPCENHTWDAGVVTTEPTCGEAGVKTLTCTVCGSTSTEEVAATGNHTASDEIVRENEVPASCSTNGSYEAVVNCAVCGAEMSRTTEVIEATGDHVYATEQSRVDATCTTPGSVTMACGCGATEVTEIPATGHAYSGEVTAPTCTEAGYTTYTCANCGDTYTADEVAATGHAYDEAVTAPTCTEAGYTTYTCSVCGDTYTGNEVAAAGHTYGEAVTAPTCTEAGYTTYTCSVCGDTYTGNEVAATGHAYEITYTKQPSCAKAGLNEYTCSACGDSYDEEIPAKGHTEQTVEGKAPTCLDDGYSEYTICSVCNSVVTPKTKIPATDHTKDAGVVTAPTYTSKGYTTYTCTECGVSFQDDWTDKLEANFTIEIREPSLSTIRCKDTMVLHTTVAGGDATGLKVVWTADNENFVTKELEDGKLEITSAEDGYTVFTASLVDASGNVVASDTVEMRSKADIWSKIGGYIRAFFGSTLYYNY